MGSGFRYVWILGWDVFWAREMGVVFESGLLSRALILMAFDLSVLLVNLS
jgi:hypothetical protein